MSRGDWRTFGGIYHADLDCSEVLDLSSYGLLLWLYLQARTELHKGRGITEQIAVADIAERMGRHPTTIRRWARELEAAGLVEREHEKNPEGGPAPVIWRILVPPSVEAKYGAQAPPARMTRRDRRREQQAERERQASARQEHIERLRTIIRGETRTRSAVLEELELARELATPPEGALVMMNGLEIPGAANRRAGWADRVVELELELEDAPAERSPLAAAALDELAAMGEPIT